MALEIASVLGDDPGLDDLFAEAWTDAGYGGSCDPGWRPFDPTRVTGFAARNDGTVDGFVAVRPLSGTDMVDFFYVRPEARRPGILAALLERAVAELAERGLARVIYVGFGWWRRPFPARLARPFERSGFGRFEGVYLGRDLIELPAIPAPPPGYVCRDWEDRFLDASIDLMEACPEPENLYWGRDLCRRSILGAAHPLRPLFPNGAGQLVFQAACDVAERESGDPGLLCAFTLATETGYVNHVYTREDHRGRGLASAAIVRLFHSLAAVGHGRTTILTHDTNPGAIALYKRLGFEELFRYPQFFLRKT